jgi:cobalt/nickel transport system permease protein
VNLHHVGDSAIHRLPAEAKIVATLVFVFAVVLTPSHAVWAFLLDAAVVTGLLVGAARLPLGAVGRRLRIELPFLLFALGLPFLAHGPTTTVGTLHLSIAGLWAGWNIVAKGTLGVLAAILLSATTPVPELLAGLARLRVPRALVAITGLMVRYLDVIVGEAARTRVARLARCDDSRWLWQARGVAATAGTLFVRSYERGERVHLAMLSRGFTGVMPAVHRHEHHAPAMAAVLPTVAMAALLAARLT